MAGVLLLHGRGHWAGDAGIQVMMEGQMDRRSFLVGSSAALAVAASGLPAVAGWVPIKPQIAPIYLWPRHGSRITDVGMVLKHGADGCELQLVGPRLTIFRMHHDRDTTLAWWPFGSNIEAAGPIQMVIDPLSAFELATVHYNDGHETVSFDVNEGYRRSIYHTNGGVVFETMCHRASDGYITHYANWGPEQRMSRV